EGAAAPPTGGAASGAAAGDRMDGVGPASTSGGGGGARAARAEEGGGPPGPGVGGAPAGPRARARRCDGRGDRGGGGRVAPHVLQLLRLEGRRHRQRVADGAVEDRKSTRLNSSHVKSSYAGFCLKKKNTRNRRKRGTSRD